jgi:hypothetical protein
LSTDLKISAEVKLKIVVLAIADVDILLRVYSDTHYSDISIPVAKLNTDPTALRENAEGILTIHPNAGPSLVLSSLLWTQDMVDAANSTAKLIFDSFNNDA